MKDLLQIFSTRELSLLFWTALALTLMLTSKGIRKSLVDVLKSLFGSSIGTVLLLLIFYVSGVLFLLHSFDGSVSDVML
jgi:hypothetical protein